MLRLGLFENRNVLVGVFPQLQKILISGFGLAMISRERQRSGKLKTRSDNDRRIVGNDPDVVDDLLKFRGSFGSAMRRQIGSPAHIDHKKGTAKAGGAGRLPAQLIGLSRLQDFDSSRGIVTVQRNLSSQKRQMTELDHRALRKP